MENRLRRIRLTIYRPNQPTRTSFVLHHLLLSARKIFTRLSPLSKNPLRNYQTSRVRKKMSLFLQARRMFIFHWKIRNLQFSFSTRMFFKKRFCFVFRRRVFTKAFWVSTVFTFSFLITKMFYDLNWHRRTGGKMIHKHDVLRDSSFMSCNYTRSFLGYLLFWATKT